MITDFLKTTATKEELTTTLKILREFKANENLEEWGAIPFMCWAKLEQFEEFLSHLVEGTNLANDTIAYMNQ